ncbi:MAG: efflux RND transporter permease subunit, partial [Planctomycetota bacterium]|nr:efflux RND transporter permease subunit [Planctomycetota bacterium]
LANPYLVVVFVLAVMVIGVVSAARLPSDLLPLFKTPAVQVLTLYPGMPPEVMERDITSRIERWTGQAVGIERQEARSLLGVSVVKDFFREDMDLNTALSQVTSLAMSDTYYLPPGTAPPMVMPFDPTASVPLCLVSVSSETMTEKQLYDVAYYEMRNRLQSIQGVIAPAVYGGVLRRIFAYLDRDQLEARNLSPLDVNRAIQSGNPFVPTGSVRIGETEYYLRDNAMVESVPELNDIPVKFENGQPIYIRDVGLAQDTNQIQSNIVRINGRRQVYIPIYRQPGANTLEIVDSVKAKSQQILQRIRQFNPEAEDLRLDVVMDQSKFVRASIDTLQTSGLIGAALVMLVVLLFLGSIRSTLIVLTAIPVAILGAFIGLFYTGDTINAMTLGGLSLAIGILVDQAIVVMENIQRHLAMGKNRRQAALDGAGEVAMPVLVSTLTFIVVFYPVVLLSGMAKFLFTPLALAVTFATLTSYIIAMTFIPVAAATLLKTSAGGGRLAGALSGAYGALAGWTLRLRIPVILAAVALSVGAGAVVPSLGTELFPPVDGGQFTILVRGELGTRIERMEALVAEIEAAVQGEVGAADPEDTDGSSDLSLLISNIGVLYDWPAAYTPNTGPMDAFLLLQLKDDRKQTAQQHASRLRAVLAKKFPHVEFAYDTGGMMTAALNFGLPSPIDIQVQGSKLEVLDEIGRAIRDVAAEVEGAVDARVAQPFDYPALRINVDRVKAGQFGLTQEDVIKNVAAAINSSVNFAPSFWIAPNGNHYFMGVQYKETEIESLDTLLDIPITGPGSKSAVLLRSVATLEETVTPPMVSHVNITRTVDVFVNVEGRDVGSVAADIRERLGESPSFTALMDEYEAKGYAWSISGEVESMQKSFGQFGTGLIIAAILVYLVMVAQFRSFLVPFVILLTVPLGGVGVIGALLVTGTHMSIPAFMGLILMVGIVVQYSILLVEFAARRIREGAEVRDAIIEAAKMRVRPVLMTSLTTVLALLPMAFGLGHGSEGNVPLARAIIGAVIGGATLALIVVPPLLSFVGPLLRPKVEEAVA